MHSTVRDLLTFPDPVNGIAARCTAALVFMLGAAALAANVAAVTGRAGAGGVAVILGALMLVGFVLRVISGPKLSPFGRLSVHVIAPLIGEPQLTSAAPKRFAQGIGVVFAAATLAAVLAGAHGVAAGILAVFLVAVGLEAFAGFCLGCWMYAKLQGAGVIADDSCPECANIWART
ncbi:DUF4395 domain-containing protein [Corynebacterium xerosis]|uniref:DUF4395 domain-containing protein n=1 Tax=Corynebacterium xerosis TaxID=1725 RepID=UPI003879A174